jgi:hypothetical protein
MFPCFKFLYLNIFSVAFGFLGVRPKQNNLCSASNPKPKSWRPGAKEIASTSLEILELQAWKLQERLR